MTRDRASARDEQRVRIPADLDRPDRILAGLSARQLAILTVPAVGLWAAYAATHRIIAQPIFAALAVPVAVAALTLALGRRDGLGLDRLAAAAVRHARASRRLVPAPDGVMPAPAWAGRDPQRAPAPLRLPCHDIGDDGVLDLGADGAALLCRAAAVGFGLRTPAEQHAMAGAFGRYLNGLSTPVQVLVRSEPIDLAAEIAGLRATAGGLPHPALEAAALAHADFLDTLAADRDLLARQVLLVLRDPHGGPDAPTRLHRHAEEAVRGLAAAGVTVTVLDEPAARGCVRAALDPSAVSGAAR